MSVQRPAQVGREKTSVWGGLPVEWEKKWSLISPTMNYFENSFLRIYIFQGLRPNESPGKKDIFKELRVINAMLTKTSLIIGLSVSKSCLVIGGRCGFGPQGANHDPIP